MSSLSIISFNNQHKNILQQSIVNNVNNNQNKCETVYANKNISKNDVLLANPTRKKTSRNTSKDTMKPSPQILAVARRNARERNRVKQVNNGFANLRDRIPNFIASTFESGRGNNKKLSKVETLRMAVEYIRSLEELLALDDQEAETLSRTSYPSPSSSSNLITQNRVSYQFSDMSASADEEMSTSSSPPPQQYVRINTATNTYEIIPAHLYEDSENFEPTTHSEHLISDTNILSASEMDFRVQGMNLLNGMDSRDSLSPGIYSDQSFSPEDIEKLHQSKCFVPVFNHIIDDNGRFQLENVKQELDESILSIKTEDDIPANHKNIITVMQWWENQTPATGS
ncbi:hypothetical protein HHI36_010048 [Cryptolaemus montrouzieri]|uniref:BHLH domain-containing protein n=1 Tax=Cryptolaemus montrouzieri TaxID=559131 RepID=A0ABD2MHL4_9CUCU